MRRFDLGHLALALTGLLSVNALAACGDDGSAQPDAAGPTNEGFVMPTAVTKANDNGTEVGNADWSCLNTPSADQPQTVATNIALTGQVRDFQSSNGVRDATVTAFAGIMLSGNLGTATSTAVAAGDRDTPNYTMTLGDLPTGETRYGFKIEHPGTPAYKRTYLLNQYFDPTDNTQTTNISAVSSSTATAVLAFVGATYDPTKGTLAGAFRDCAGNEVSNAVATVSSVSGAATHLPGANTFYFGRTTGLPARHNVEPVSSSNGLFVVIDLAPQTAPAYIQVWGFPTQADLTAGTLKLLSELPSPVEADAIITGSFEAKRSN